MRQRGDPAIPGYPFRTPPGKLPDGAEMGCRLKPKQGAGFVRNEVPVTTVFRCRLGPIYAGQQTNCDRRERFAFAPARRLVRTAAHPFQSHLRVRNAKHARGLQAGGCYVLHWALTFSW